MPTGPLGRPGPKARISNQLRYEFDRQARELDKQIKAATAQRKRLREASKALRG